MDFHKLKFLVASKVEKHIERPYREVYCSSSMQKIYKLIKNENKLKKSQVKDVSRLVLRELFMVQIK